MTYVLLNRARKDIVLVFISDGKLKPHLKERVSPPVVWLLLSPAYNEDRVRQKRAVFNTCRKALQNAPGLEFMPEPALCRSNRWLTVILITPEIFGATPEAVRLALGKENIETRPVWQPMHLQPVFRAGLRKDLGVQVHGGAVAEDLFARGLCLPSGTAMTEADIMRVVKS